MVGEYGIEATCFEFNYVISLSIEGLNLHINKFIYYYVKKNDILLLITKKRKKCLLFVDNNNNKKYLNLRFFPRTNLKKDVGNS